ncbi:MAG: hypothetical protein AB1434_06560 [Pseudomonadota bacterium]
MHKDRPTPSNRLNFTKRVLDRLTLPSEGVAYFYDTDTKGLAISVGKTGRKSFLLYRRIQGRPERIKIGPRFATPWKKPRRPCARSASSRTTAWD